MHNMHNMHGLNKSLVYLFIFTAVSSFLAYRIVVRAYDSFLPMEDYEQLGSIKPREHRMIRVSTPALNSIVASPLKIKGKARGNWYFEASFPVRLYDGNGKELAVIPAQAQGEWMTTDFVPFEVMLTFPKPTTSSGVLVLEKDNPSGLPEHDDKISIPVRFSQ